MVLPMPRYFLLRPASSRMRAWARSMAARTSSWGRPAPKGNDLMASTAKAEATSPATCPPIAVADNEAVLPYPEGILVILPQSPHICCRFHIHAQHSYFNSSSIALSRFQTILNSQTAKTALTTQWTTAMLIAPQRLKQSAPSEWCRRGAKAPA